MAFFLELTIEAIPAFHSIFNHKDHKDHKGHKGPKH